jgi:drug/metabolite transporter (DMT)-like permease
MDGQEATMLKELLGPGLVLMFAVSQAFRDVYFANVFQGIDFFLVIALAFSISTAIFTGVTVLREPAVLGKLRRELPALLWINVTTAIAWISYFFSLKHLQPSVVNTLHSGAGPLTVIALASFGLHIARPSAVGKGELVCYGGLAAALAFICWAVLAGHGGARTDSLLVTAAGLLLPLVSGAAITISLLWCKRLNDRGIGADAITAARYLLIIAVALVVTIGGERPSNVGTGNDLLVLAAAATVLIVLPLYSLQLGIARTAPLTAHVIRSLGPVLIFGLELADGRIGYSGAILAGIVLYALFAVASNLVRGFGGAGHAVFART